MCESLGWQIACVEDDDANEAAQLAIDSFPNEMEGLPDVDGLTVVGRLGTWIGYSTVDQADWTPPYDPAEDYGTFVWHGACSPKDQSQILLGSASAIHPKPCKLVKLSKFRSFALMLKPSVSRLA